MASNSCIPASSPLSALVPPLPTTTRGEPCVLDGHYNNADRPVLLYGSGKLVVARQLDGEIDGASSGNDPNRVQAFVYRGHIAQVTAAKFSPSGAYVASGDARGKLRVWSYEDEDHMCKLDLQCLTGPIRDICWDVESKRICIVGERSDVSSACSKVIEWDTGAKRGDLGQHSRGRASSCTFQPIKNDKRIVTGGKDDFRVMMNAQATNNGANVPFTKVQVVDGIPSEYEHSRGAVNCLRYNTQGTRLCSVGSDKTVCLYDGMTMALQAKLTDVHHATIYACAWSSDDQYIITCSADGTVKLLEVATNDESNNTELSIVHTWNVASEQLLADSSSSSTSTETKVPLGGMQLGCAFVKGDIPVSVGVNGQIAMLPKPPGDLLSNSRGILPNYKFLTGHTAPIADMAMNRTCTNLYTGDTDGVLCQWDVRSHKAVRRFQKDGQEAATDDLMGKIHGGAVSCLSVVGDDGTVWSAGWDDAIRIADANGTVNPDTIPLEAQPNAMATGSDLVVVATVNGLHLVKKDGNSVSDMITLDYSALSVCMSLDDTTVYVGGDDCKIHVYTVTASRDGLDETHVIENGHLKPVHALALSNDGTKLASADVKDVCVWSLADDYAPVVGKSRWCFHTQRITCLSWSPDDTVVASGGADDSIYLWCLEKKMKRVHYPFCHRGGVTGLQFLRGDTAGLVLVSVGVDACVNQWDVTDDVAKKFG